MNKKLLLLALTTGGVQLMADVKKELNIRTVNILDIMRNTEEGKAVGLELEERRKTLTEEIRADDQKFAQAMNDFKNKSATLSDTAREKEEARLMKMRNSLEAKVKNSEEELKHAMQRASDRLTTKVQAKVADIAKAKNIDLMIDEASGRVLYSAKETSCTNDVVVRLNADYKKELAQAKGPQAAQKIATASTKKPQPKKSA